MRILRILGFAAALSAGFSAYATAQDVKGAVSARQALMDLRQHYLGTLFAMAKERIPYDAARAGSAAASLHALSSVDQSAMWPKGSDTDTLADATRTLPALWSNYPQVMEIAKSLNAATENMAMAAGKDLASLQGALGPVAGACTDCHKAFRQPN